MEEWLRKRFGEHILAGIGERGDFRGAYIRKL